MSAEPIWLLHEFVIAVHERLIADYGDAMLCVAESIMTAPQFAQWLIDHTEPNRLTK